MTTMTPIETIADALIDFILSLLRDPAAAEEYTADPEGTMDRAGLGGACLADVRSVAPVIYDRPDVVSRPTQTYGPVSNTPSGSGGHPSTPVERAIQNIVNNFTVDNRATIVDQSVNQNIWAHGDVTQVFDQHAVVNTGDAGAAAGHDAIADSSTTTVGHDVNVGNTTTDTTIDGSFNDNSTDTATDTDNTFNDSFNDNSTTTTTDTTIDSSFDDNSDDSQHIDDSDHSADVVVTDSDDVSLTTTTDSAPEEAFVDDQP